jgi:hypothetical protein
MKWGARKKTVSKRGNAPFMKILDLNLLQV